MPTERPAEWSDDHRPIITCAIDDEALAALESRGEEQPPRCDACDALIEGEPAGKGLLLWARGEEVRYEEPLLCWACAAAVGITALHRWEIEEEQEG